MTGTDDAGSLETAVVKITGEDLGDQPTATAMPPVKPAADEAEADPPPPATYEAEADPPPPATDEGEEEDVAAPAPADATPVPVWIHGECYDISGFHDHPGGAAWLKCVEGRCITTHFETHHLRIERARRRLRLLPRLDTSIAPVAHDWDWSEDGFYATLRARAAAFLVRRGGHVASIDGDVAAVPKEVWLHATGSTTAMSVTRLFAVMVYVAAFVTTCITQRAEVAVLCGVMTAVMGGFGHSAFHRRGRTWDCWLFECAGLSHEEWRSGDHTEHHMNPNLPEDPDTGSMDPFVIWGPPTSEFSMLRRILSPLVFHVVAALAVSSMQASHLICPRQIGRSRSNSGLVVPSIMLLLLWLSGLLLALRPDPYDVSSGLGNDYTSGALGMLRATGLWALIWCSGSFYFMMVSYVNHNQEANWTAELYLVQDWGAWQLQTSSDIEVPCGLRGVPLFGMLYVFLHEQTLHHLFPALDHSRLDSLRPLVKRTAEEFGFQLRPPESYFRLYVGMLATIAGVSRSKKA